MGLREVLLPRDMYYRILA